MPCSSHTRPGQLSHPFGRTLTVRRFVACGGARGAAGKQEGGDHHGGSTLPCRTSPLRVRHVHPSIMTSWRRWCHQGRVCYDGDLAPPLLARGRRPRKSPGDHHVWLGLRFLGRRIVRLVTQKYKCVPYGNITDFLVVSLCTYYGVHFEVLMDILRSTYGHIMEFITRSLWKYYEVHYEVLK